MIRKTFAFLLAAFLLFGCAAPAENAAGEEHIIQSGEGDFILSFQLPENAELISGEWISPAFYTANIRSSTGLYIYLSVVGPDLESPEMAEDTSPVTYNDANGFTDEYLNGMIDELFSDDYSKYDKSIAVTAYGTKLAIVRFNDAGSPYAYIFTVWQNYEIGLSIFSVDGSGNPLPITDDQISQIVNFISELWVYQNKPETGNTADDADSLARFIDINMSTPIQAVKANHKVLKVSGLEDESTFCFIEPVDGTAGLESAVKVTAGDDTLGLKILNLPNNNIPGITELILNPADELRGAADSMTEAEIDAYVSSRKAALQTGRPGSVRLLPGSGWHIIWTDECLQAVPDQSGTDSFTLISVPGHAGEKGQVVLSNGTISMEISAAILSDGFAAIYSVNLE